MALLCTPRRRPVVRRARRLDDRAPRPCDRRRRDGDRQFGRARIGIGNPFPARHLARWPDARLRDAASARTAAAPPPPHHRARSRARPPPAPSPERPGLAPPYHTVCLYPHRPTVRVSLARLPYL